ncbi:MAG: single-stranded DNA-binding protein [Pseudomonas sp.]|uniref:single-stranded DNA-binding protein n=1 Tax=Pseudomonas sp. TaxID=306 RepID=UPI00264A38B8|nr:single-stranded DNA-binding protein [Pseudomonas sp.]MDN5390741.1 single-stranded DNA-binding protein [Pseudomonas sp.]MDN5405287.1 single-stranded DNA-binding protein [Pseudomonas sp.]MDN5452937.1 single-stranded DNA-binding protein [Pseudomonas sp.]MDN5456819.1 single-stranded DNA-binding protein [Pseudomonas sp.]MDN5670827.1 single-stranded DNA-binding protein [Pseudomonas sp.]
MPQLTDIGRIGRDAELRYTTGQNPTAVVALTLACDYGRKGQDGKKPTQWVEAVIFGKQAEAMAPYLVRGQLMHFTIDDVHIEEFKRGDGTPGNKLTGKVIAIKFAGSPPQGVQQNQQPRQQQRPQQQAPQQSQQGTNGPDYDSFNDDIPFAPHHHLHGA